jgi:plasmid stability protein
MVAPKWRHAFILEPIMSLNLSIKGVPESLAERLRARAERNHRSLQGELMAIIERAAAEAEPRPEHLRAADAARWPLVSERRGSVSIEQIAAEHLARYPQPFEGLPRAVDIIRKDRDSR